MSENTKPPAVASRRRASGTASLGAAESPPGSLVPTRDVKAPAGEIADDFDPGERILAIMGGAERKGYWEPAPRVSVLALWGGVKLDFREASLLDGETRIDILALMGGVTILVPRDIDVEVEGSGVMGGFAHLSHRAEDENAPLLRITGFAVMGGVDVKLK